MPSPPGSRESSRTRQVGKFMERTLSIAARALLFSTTIAHCSQVLESPLRTSDNCLGCRDGGPSHSLVWSRVHKADLRHKGTRGGKSEQMVEMRKIWLLMIKQAITVFEQRCAAEQARSTRTSDTKSSAERIELFASGNDCSLCRVQQGYS
ncbi:hypothetical protein M3J09_013868 [Ascochyta lentis]